MPQQMKNLEIMKLKSTEHPKEIMLTLDSLVMKMETCYVSQIILIT